MQLNINTDAAVRFTNTLEKLHKSALPSAIRGTLNSAVFDVKTSTMPTKADATFKKREPNFFKANSRFENATGFNVNSMKATVGFIEGRLKGDNNYAVRDLEQQEEGGSIDKRSFKPLEKARRGGTGVVRSNARLAEIKNIVNSKNSRAANKMQEFIKASVFAGRDGYVLGGNVLWKVTSLKRTGRNIRFKKNKLYSFNKNGKAKVQATGFMKKASLESAHKMEAYYIQQAGRQIAKFK